MWTNENRARYDRSKLRYPSDVTDDEWAHVEPLIPTLNHDSPSSDSGYFRNGPHGVKSHL